ncbi:MAG: YHS domain-containing (seleno)protein [Flavobacteriaceae bacterium]
MKILSLLFIFLSCSTIHYSQQHFNTNKGVAIDGYDLVSYFEGNAEKGSHAYTAEMDGVVYWFTSEDHRMQFEKAPLQYLPQYGGFCAYAMGTSGEKVSINPKAYLISEGKLYLFYKNLVSNTLKKWQDENPELLQKKANENWEELIKN